MQKNIKKNKPDSYAVIGNPIAHSKSPDIHSRFAVQTSQSLEYARLLSPLDSFRATVADFVKKGGKGLNVTVPFKLEAFDLATRLSERAKAAGAVNTLRFDNGEIYGDNTDGAGLIRDIKINAGISISGKRVLLLGAGGAARGVLNPLIAENPSEIVIANRTLNKAQELADIFGNKVKVSACSYTNISGAFDIVINGTSAGLTDETPPVPKNAFGENCLAYDMVYGKNPTAFMRFAKDNGAIVRDGLGMLVEQAAESFFVWRKIRPETVSVLKDLRASL